MPSPDLCTIYSLLYITLFWPKCSSSCLSPSTAHTIPAATTWVPGRWLQGNRPRTASNVSSSIDPPWGASMLFGGATLYPPSLLSLYWLAELSAWFKHHKPWAYDSVSFLVPVPCALPRLVSCLLLLLMFAWIRITLMFATCPDLLDIDYTIDCNLTWLFAWIQIMLLITICPDSCLDYKLHYCLFPVTSQPLLGAWLASPYLSRFCTQHLPS